MASFDGGHLHPLNHGFDDQDSAGHTHVAGQLHPTPHSHRRIPALPDLRFEYSYLRNVKTYVQVERIDKPRKDTKGKEVALSQDIKRDHPHQELIHVQWGMLVWVTMRDQVISPLLQGALWGLASHLILPMRSALAAGIRSWWGPTSYHPNHEGGGVARLRSWAGGLYSGNVKTSLAR